MKIGFDAKRAYQNYTGLGNYSRDLLRNLFENQADYSYNLYTPKITKNPNLGFIKDHNNVKEITPTTPLDKTFKGLWRSINLEKTLINDKIDIFHGLSNEIPRRGKSSSIKYVVTIHDLIFKRYPRNYKAIDRRIYNTKFKYACKNADKIIAISDQTKNDIIEFYDIPEDRITTIYQTCHENFKKDYSTEIKEHIRQKFTLPKEYILNVGTIETRKNLIGILKAIPLMRNDLPLVVVGRKTKYFNFIKVQMQKLKIDPNRVIFLKNVSIEELPSIYQMASVFVYPSFFEGFGIPIIEALHSHTPVITSKGSCFPEAGGPDSIFIDPTSSEEIGAAIDDLLNSKEKQSQMAIAGKKFAQKFEPEILTQQLLDVYQNL